MKLIVCKIINEIFKFFHFHLKFCVRLDDESNCTENISCSQLVQINYFNLNKKYKEQIGCALTFRGLHRQE